MRGGRPSSDPARPERLRRGSHIAQIAVGMFDGTTFSSSSVGCRPGDLFALLTDGLIEVFDAERDQLGFEWAKRVLRSSGNQPLSASPIACWPTHGPTAASSTIKRSADTADLTSRNSAL